MSLHSHKPYVVEGTSEPEHDVDAVEMHSLYRHGGTAHDEHDMQMLGTVQVLNVSAAPPA